MIDVLEQTSTFLVGIDNADDQTSDTTTWEEIGAKQTFYTLTTWLELENHGFPWKLYQDIHPMISGKHIIVHHLHEEDAAKNSLPTAMVNYISSLSSYFV